MYVQKAPTAAKAQGLNTDDAKAALTHDEYESDTAPAQAMLTTAMQPQQVNPLSIVVMASEFGATSDCKLDFIGGWSVRSRCFFAEPFWTTNDFVSTVSEVPDSSEAL